MLLPLVSGFSPHPPVSVCGTGADVLGSGFSRQRGILRFGTCIFPTHWISAVCRGICLPAALHPWPDLPAARSDFPSASPLPSYAHRQYRNFNLLSVAYAFRPRLRPRLTPGGRTFPGKPRVFDGADSHRALATHSGILTTVSSACPSGHASPSRYAPLPIRTHVRIPRLRYTV